MSVFSVGHSGIDAMISAGTTISKDVAEDELAISRVNQKKIANWKRPYKK